MAFLDGERMAFLDMVKQQLYFLDVVSTIFWGGDSIKRLEDLMENSSMEQEDRDKFPKFGIVVSGINQCIISSWFWVPKCVGDFKSWVGEPAGTETAVQPYFS